MVELTDKEFDEMIDEELEWGAWLYNAGNSMKAVLDELVYRNSYFEEEVDDWEEIEEKILEKSEKMDNYTRNKRLERIARNIASDIELDMEFERTTEKSFIQDDFNIKYSEISIYTDLDDKRFRGIIHRMVNQLLDEWNSTENIEEFIKISKKIK